MYIGGEILDCFLFSTFFSSLKISLKVIEDTIAELVAVVFGHISTSFPSGISVKPHLMSTSLLILE